MQHIFINPFCLWLTFNFIGSGSEESVDGGEAIREQEESQHIHWLLLDDSEEKYESFQ
jgi:hypothetical protein